MQCPSCGADEQDLWRYCESCGTPLKEDSPHDQTVTVTVSSLSSSSSSSSVSSSVTSVTVSDEATHRSASVSTHSTVILCRCGAGPDQRDAQGFCEACGLLVTSVEHAVSNGDHKEIALSPGFAAVTDIGKRHRTNQDDVAIATYEIDGKTIYVIAVCDGLSSSCAAEAASSTAAKTACDSLLAVAKSSPATEDLPKLVEEAIMKAHQAVCAVKFTPVPGKDGPATTIVAAIVRDGIATIGWVGDSRAYLISDGFSAMLSHDHSWVNAMVDSGQMSQAEAEASPEAHVIIQCLGPVTDEDGSLAEDPEPSVTTTVLPAGGYLVLCSDGLWNFVLEADQIAALLKGINSDAEALDVSRILVGHANACGGRDNITAAILQLDRKV